jgi:hypothetical protein
VSLPKTTLAIPAGATTKAFTVQVKGDTTSETLDEIFYVNLSNAQFAKVADAQAVGTIRDDDAPRLSIADMSVAEGASGTKVLAFTVTLDRTPAVAVTYDIATSDRTALAGSDYVARALVGETIAAGTRSRNFNVTIKGDTTVEPNQSFLVRVSNVANAAIADGVANGTILNDDGATLSIGDVSMLEGASGTKILVFTASLSQAAASTVTFDLATADGTATTANNDYTGDAVVEPDETFVVNLTNATGPASVLDAQAIGTITNDD